MSKSIYSDALAIIDNIYKSDTIEGFTYYVVKRLPPAWEVNMDELEKMKHALKQAHKQQKLLELYKDINNKRKELLTISGTNKFSLKLDIEIKEIEKRIKEIENE